MQLHTYPIMYEVEEKHWWYVGRRRIIETFLDGVCKSLGAVRPRILDVGCGTGANLVALGRFGEVEGVDISPDAIEFCRERGLNNVRLGQAERLPYEDRTFDIVTSFDMVEHLDDDLAGLREIRRVLRPGGRTLIFVPAFMFLWGVQDDVSNHRRRYTLPQLCNTVRAAGFEIDRATYANISFFAPILLVRTLMRITGIRTESENTINISALNGVLARILGSESRLLRRISFPFGVSIICVGRAV
jgi:SAM-dependent methyltransferase